MARSEANAAVGLVERLGARLTLPIIAAPMFRVSGPDLVVAAGRAGVIGAFPTANCRTVDELDAWLDRFDRELGAEHAPYCPNLIIRRAGLADDLACLLNHRVELVITSVGSPQPVLEPLHDAGCTVFADVASVRHARKAIEAGVDGLVLLSAGAGGQTGWVNGLAFARAVRELFDGPIVLAGGIGDGHGVLAAQALGCDLAYLGTAFIATEESMASAAYKAMLVDSSADDVLLTSAMSGLPTNMLRPSLIAAGLDPDALPTDLSEQTAAALYGGGSSGGAGREGPKRWRDLWSAGHSVSAVHRVRTVAQLVADLRTDYDTARQALLRTR